LNYLYAVLESEARLGAAILGLDPGLGVLHADKPVRDGLACDLMEPVRPKVDAYLLDGITRAPLKRDWFFEKPDGSCRLMGSFAIRLSETAQTWGRAVAPIAEWVARTLSIGIPKPNKQIGPGTRLTQRHRREAKDCLSQPFQKPAPRPQTVCRICGTGIEASGRIVHYVHPIFLKIILRKLPARDAWPRKVLKPKHADQPQNVATTLLGQDG
jgi:hypothetical protein